MISPEWQALIFVGAQCVCGLLGYYQGRRHEELYWRRVVGTLDKQQGIAPDRWAAP